MCSPTAQNGDNESTSTAKFYSKLSQQAALHVRTIQLAIQIESLTFNRLHWMNWWLVSSLGMWFCTQRQREMSELMVNQPPKWPYRESQRQSWLLTLQRATPSKTRMCVGVPCSVTHKWSDHHLQYEWQWIVALLLKVGVIYLWSKVVCLFCFVLFCLYRWDPPNRDASDHVLALFGKLSTRRGAWAWFHGVWTCGAKILEYWIISSLKIKLNCSWKFWRNWNVPLVLLERCWWARFNGIYLVRFGFRMWEISIFRWFLPLKIQINSKKPGFVRKISWERGNTWRLTIQFKYDFLSYLAVQIIDKYIAKQCSHVEFPYFVMGSHLGQQQRPRAEATLVGV